MESSNRIKLSLSKKLKEYANKMGRDHLGGDDIPGNKKKGGLRDNDGYDNVQYNRDMPQDESVSETTLFGEFLQEGIESVNEANVKSKDSRGMRFAEAIYNNVSAIIKAVEREKMDVDRVVNSFGPVLVNAIKTTLKHKFKPTAGNEDKLKSFYSKLKELLKVAESLVKRPSKAGIKKLDASHREWWNHNGGADVVLNGKYADNIIESVVNEGKVDRVVGHTRYKYVGDGRKGQAIVSGPMKDREKEAIIKRAKKAGYSAKPNMGGGVTIHVESVNESMFSAIDQIRQDSKDVRDFVKNVFKDREFKKMSNDKDFIKYLKSIYEGINESIPQNFHQGRVSDYHTALRGKQKDYSGGTNFKKKSHGQPDIDTDDEDQETNHLSNKQLHVKAKLKVAESGKKKI